MELSIMSYVGLGLICYALGLLVGWLIWQAPRGHMR
jgi:hypothetical protein